ncbi:spherulin-1A [Usnea florida]
MLFSTLVISAQLSILAFALPAPLNDSTTLPDIKGPSTIANNKNLIQSLELAPTAKERINLITNDADFVYDFNNPPQSAVTTGKGGHTVRADREVFPPLVGTGVSMTLGFIGPCGFNTPHTHPRSSEINVVVKGSLITEFTLENGARGVANRLDTNQMTVFPQGAVHTEFNPGCDDALFVAGFASEDPGVQQAAQTLLGLGDDVVRAAVGQEAFKGEDVDRVRSRIPANVAEGVEKCLVQCHISKR